MTLVLLAMMGYYAYIIYTDIREYKREKKSKEQAKEQAKEQDKAQVNKQERLIYYQTTVNGKRYDAAKVDENNECKGCAAEHDARLCVALPACIRMKLKCIYIEHKEEEE